MFLNYLLGHKYLRKKMSRKQYWNMWILEYLLDFSPNGNLSPYFEKVK